MISIYIIKYRENIGSKTLVPIRSQNELLSREVDKEINNMNV